MSALLLCAGTAAAQEGVFDRLSALLEAIPGRWESLPAPVVPVSGRSTKDVLGTASQEQVDEVYGLVSRLSQAPPEDRAAKIREELRERQPTELDLWLPQVLAQALQGQRSDDAAAALEIGLQLAEALGRRDALLFAASSAIDLLRLSKGAPAALPILRAWAALPPAPGAERGRAVLQLSLADALIGLGENQQALAAYRNARGLFVAVGDPLGQGNAWDGEADVLLRLGENQQALAAYRSARKLFVARGDQLGQGNTWEGEADVLLRLGENQQALAAYRSGRELFAAVGIRVGQGNTWRGEADVLLRLGDIQGSLSAYRSARDLFVAIGDRRGQGIAWKGEADILFSLGESQQALSAYRSARDLFVAAGDRLGQGNTWRGEADILRHLGENEKALAAYRSARDLFVAVGDRQGEGNAWRGEADLLLDLEENQRSLAAYRHARDLFVAVGDPMGQGNTWQGEAGVLLRLGKSQEALAAYRSARQIFAATGSPSGQGNAWLGEADVHFRLGENPQALAACRRARELFVAIGSFLGQGHAWRCEARALQRLDDKATAAAAATAITMYRKAGLVAGELSAFLFKAAAENRAGDALAAAESATEAIRLYSRWRKTWITDRHRTGQEGNITEAYDILVPLRARQGAVAEALRLAEEARSRVLLDLLVAGPGRGESVPAVDLMAERQRLMAELWQVEEQLRHPLGPERQAELRSRRRHLDQELEWNRYRRIAAQEESFPEASPLDAAAIQALARETGPLLLYYAADWEVLGFLVLPGAEVVLRPIAISWGQLAQEVSHLVRDLANPLYEPRAEARARKLWDLLIAPFADKIPAGGPLVLVPNGLLHELPFEALLDPAGRLLFERWQISVTPSASALAFARRGHAAPSPDDLFLAFSAGRGLNLPIAEVAEISGFFGTNQATFRPTEARYENYEKLVTRARHVLIATRGVHTEGSRAETYLEIEPTPGVHDSRLSAIEIATIPLQAELVTLAACDTSHGLPLMSDDRLDLTRSFLSARAAAVLATRWKVPEDVSTSRFLTDFYRAYRQGGPKGEGLRKDEALTEARRRSRERGDPAQVWAAWVLVGDAR